MVGTRLPDSTSPIDPTIDLDDTTHCPTAATCATCAGRGDRIPVTVDTPVGVLCLTVCRACARRQRLPRLSVGAAAAAVLDHCEHLGIDPDQAAAARTGTAGEVGR